MFNVRWWHRTDLAAPLTSVRCRGQSRHRNSWASPPLLTPCGRLPIQSQTCAIGQDERSRLLAGAYVHRRKRGAYLSACSTCVKVVLSLEPTPCTSDDRNGNAGGDQAVLNGRCAATVRRVNSIPCRSDRAKPQISLAHQKDLSWARQIEIGALVRVQARVGYFVCKPGA